MAPKAPCRHGLCWCYVVAPHTPLLAATTLCLSSVFRHGRGVAVEPRHGSVQRRKSDAKTTSSSATCNAVYDYISGMRQVPHRQDRDRPETTNP
ncbi:hypothetical protein TRIUR3_29021 [Triticum urartu]|uniref:Secreted protein n=1 Tax=Triticum urartu TaxID=4572 RepID=M8B0H8_TRIUA|nr:hypothetical protein TRIUR3_29021 [Triticum urartu]